MPVPGQIPTLMSRKNIQLELMKIFLALYKGQKKDLQFSNFFEKFFTHIKELVE